MLELIFELIGKIENIKNFLGRKIEHFKKMFHYWIPFPIRFQDFKR